MAVHNSIHSRRRSLLDYWMRSDEVFYHTVVKERLLLEYIEKLRWVASGTRFVKHERAPCRANRFMRASV